MNWAFALLGLTPDADAASVKRAYARLLRNTRPDDDPEAFQRLHTAYKMVLAHVAKAAPPPISAPPVTAQKEPQRPDTVTPPTSPPPRSSVAKPASAPAIHLGNLTNDVIRAAVEAENGSALFHQLQKRPEFWSIQVKQQTAQIVLQRLFQQPQPISADGMDALLRFFDLDHVLSGINPVAVQALRARQRTLWELLPEHHHELARRIGLVRNGRPDVLSLRKDLAFLQRPFHWLRTTSAAMQSHRGRRLARLIQALAHNSRVDDMPASMDQRQAIFWSRGAIAGTSLTWERFALNTLRACIWTLAVILAVVGIFAMGGESGGTDWHAAIRTSSMLGSTVIGGWLLIAGCWWFDQWQGQPEASPARWPWLRRLAMPLLCVSSVALQASGWAHAFGGMLAALSFVFAVRRFRRRTPTKSELLLRAGRFAPVIIFLSLILGAPLVHKMDDSDSLTTAMALLGLALWGIDIWLHRAYLHPKLARS